MYLHPWRGPLLAEVSVNMPGRHTEHAVYTAAVNALYSFSVS